MGNIKVRLEGEVNREIEYPDGRKFYSIEGSFQDEKDERVHTYNKELDEELELLSGLYEGDIEYSIVEYEVPLNGEEIDFNIVNIVVTTMEE